LLAVLCAGISLCRGIDELLVPRVGLITLDAKLCRVEEAGLCMRTEGFGLLTPGLLTGLGLF